MREASLGMSRPSRPQKHSSFERANVVKSVFSASRAGFVAKDSQAFGLDADLRALIRSALDAGRPHHGTITKPRAKEALPARGAWAESLEGKVGKAGYAWVTRDKAHELPRARGKGALRLKSHAPIVVQVPIRGDQAFEERNRKSEIKPSPRKALRKSYTRPPLIELKTGRSKDDRTESDKRIPWTAHGTAPMSVEVIEGPELTRGDSDVASQFLDSITKPGPREELLTWDALAERIGLRSGQCEDDWLKHGKVIGWRGTRQAYVFPARQLDARGRPPLGLNRILPWLGNGYSAWIWLTTPLLSLAGSKPLDLLRGGETDRVEIAARGDAQGDFA